MHVPLLQEQRMFAAFNLRHLRELLSSASQQHVLTEHRLERKCLSLFAYGSWLLRLYNLSTVCLHSADGFDKR